MKVRVSCRGVAAVGKRHVADWAMRALREKKPREYGLAKHNCHLFTYECLMGKRTEGPIMLLDVMSAAAEVLGADNWRVWSFRRDRG